MIYDKRKLRRHDIFLIVEFKPLKSGGGFSIGITRDLSPDGFSLESQTIECQRGDILEFRLKHPDAEWTVDISGEVIWRNHSWYKYIIGIKFLKVDEEQNTKILKLMSAVKDASNTPDLNSNDSESMQGTEKEKHLGILPVAGAKDHQLPDTLVAKVNNAFLREAQHCELTGTERTFIAGDVVGISIAETSEEIKLERRRNDSDKNFKAALIKNPESVQVPVNEKTADNTARTDVIKEADAEHEKIYAGHLNTSYRPETAQGRPLNINPAQNNLKKKLWLYVPFAMVVIIILAIALPVMIEKFNHSSVDSIPVLTESTAKNNDEKDKDIPAQDYVQMSSQALNKPSVPSSVKQTGTTDAIPAEKNIAANVRQASSAGQDSTGILPSKSIVMAEVKSKKTEDSIPPAQIVKTPINTPQMNNANIIKPETGTADKELRDNAEKSRKIDLIAKIDETFKDLRTIQNEKQPETEVVIKTEKTTGYKPLIKTEEQPVTTQVVRLEETPVAATVTEHEKIPDVKQEVTATEEKKSDIKKPDQSVKRPTMPNLALLVKRDNSRTSINNSPAAPGITTNDLLKKWTHIGSTKSGVPLFIAPDKISNPNEPVVNLLVKASVNKKDFIDLLAINCSQIKLRILEERNGNNPAFSSYSNEWKDIIPDSMILYNSACQGKK